MKLSYFYTLNITNEDIEKTKQYKAQSTRKKISETFDDIHDFYNSLNIQLKIDESDSFSIPRISQLTMKTNQFNLRTKRYSVSDITNFHSDHNKLVYYLTVKDKVGDYGIVGVFIGDIVDKDIIIDTLLMSCRVIGRDIEIGFLSYLFENFFRKGFQKIKGEYLPTKKNIIVKNLYKDIGFTYNGRNWIFDLSLLIDMPGWLTINNE